MKSKIVNAARQALAEACWKGYRAKGMKKKGNRMVPNCVKETQGIVGMLNANVADDKDDIGKRVAAIRRAAAEARKLGKDPVAAADAMQRQLAAQADEEHYGREIEEGRRLASKEEYEKEGYGEAYKRLKQAQKKKRKKPEPEPKPKPKHGKRDVWGRSDSRRLTTKQQDKLRKKEAAEARAKIRLAAAKVRREGGSKKAQKKAAEEQRGEHAVPMDPHPQGTSTERKDQIEKNRREAASGKAAARLRKEIADDDAERARRKRAEG